MKRGFIINLGSVDDIAIGHGKRFVVKGEELAVFRCRDGKIRALKNRCPQGEGSLADGFIERDIVMCSLHEHGFDLKTGKGTAGKERVPVYEAWIEHGDIFVEFEPSTERKSSFYENAH